VGSLRINFAEVEGSFTPLPGDTWYQATIERVEVRESNSSDNDYLNWEFKVTEDEYEGRRLWMISSFSEKALFRLKDTLVALEVIDPEDELDIEWEDGVDITPKEGPLVTNPELDGIACEVLVTNEVYEGKERNRVSDVRLPGASSAPAKASKSNGTSKSASGPKPRQRKLR
jgi:hypothetical protein